MSVLAASVAFVACDNYDLPNPPAQSNPAEVPFDINKLVVSQLPVTADGPAILAEYNNNGKLVPVAGVTVTDWPATYVLNMTMNLTAKGKTVQVPCTVLSDTVFVAPDDLDAAYRTITKSPAITTVEVNFTPTAGTVNGTGSFLLGGPGYTTGAEQFSFKPFDPAVVIEDSYNLVLGGQTYALKHASDENVYDDPNFSVVVDVTSEMVGTEGAKWTVAAGTGAPVYGGSDELTGTLEEGATGTVNLVGPVMFKFNMESKAYEIYVAYPCLYTPGGANGWSQANSTPIYTSDYTNYSGWIHADGEFKFCATLDWAKNWGVGASAGQLAEGGGNIAANPGGCYYAKVNLGSLTYSLVHIDNCGLIGDATPNGWNGQTNLTQDPANPMIFSGRINFNGGGEYKVRFNDNWDINLGGNPDNLTEGGANISGPSAGEKTVTLDLSQFPYTITIK